MSTMLRKVLLTGGTGVLGSHLLRQLGDDRRNHLLLPSRRPLGLPSFPATVETVAIDLADTTGAQALVRSFCPDVLIHCAASGLRYPKPDWFPMMRFNVESTLRLFEAACEIPDCHFIHVSAGLVYRSQDRPLVESDPLDSLHPYGASKAAADVLIRAAAAEFRRRLTVLRPFSFTGLHDCSERIFPQLLRAAAERKPLAMSPGQQIRDFCAAQDIAAAVVRCVEAEPNQSIEVLNLGSGNAIPLRRLLEQVCDQLRLDVELQTGARPYHPHEPMHLVADIAKARQVLGWRPTINLAYCVWELARAHFPSLPVAQPGRDP
ncbi:MAG: NAD(P)-dependent oxidoreductase [Pirellulaceae bacterium]|nr:NAD(P)-dependent oxidoreductase [Pirellulaceae bacterium]